MSVNNVGHSYCQYCGAEFRLFTIFNRDMQGLCKAWKSRHEFKCKDKTPAQRRKWAKKYTGKESTESSLTVDITHQGFLDKSIIGE